MHVYNQPTCPNPQHPQLYECDPSPHSKIYPMAAIMFSTLVTGNSHTPPLPCSLSEDPIQNTARAPRSNPVSIKCRASDVSPRSTADSCPFRRNDTGHQPPPPPSAPKAVCPRCTPRPPVSTPLRSPMLVNECSGKISRFAIYSWRFA